jgi:hypothetical protein
MEESLSAKLRKVRKYGKRFSEPRQVRGILTGALPKGVLGELTSQTYSQRTVGPAAKTCGGLNGSFTS